jgi:hypothetical protein
VPGLLVDVLRGENFIGEEVDVKTGGGLGTQAASRLVPLFAQDLAQAWRIEGLAGGFKTAPGFVGFNVQTYESTAAVRQAGAQELHSKNWNELNGEEQAEVEAAYADELARQRTPAEGSIGQFLDNEALTLRAFEQDANTALAQGTVDPRTFTQNMVDRNTERVHRISGVMEREQLESSDAQKLLSSFFDLRDQATIAGETDYELLGQLEDNFLGGLERTERDIIEKRRSFQHAPEVQWWVDARKVINGSGYWDVQSTAMGRVRGLISRLAPGVETYNQLLARSRDPNLSRAEALRFAAVVRRVDQLTRSLRDRQRATDPELDDALVSVYGLTPIRRRRR